MRDRREIYLAAVLATLVSLAAGAYFLHAGTILDFGDAAAHLNIGRKIVDSKTPGWPQIGTVWLPLPHLLTALTVWYDPLWRSGVAGSLPSVAGFIAGAIFLFLIARRLGGSLAWAALAVYSLNLNLLYLQSTPMTEAQAIGAFLGVVYFAMEEREIPAALCLLAGTLIRYDAWFYLPFFALYLWRKCGLKRAAIFTGIVALGPLAWLIHNQAYYGNALEWYNGPYAPAAIEARSGSPVHPGTHNLWVALLYFWKAVRLTCGNLPAWMAVAGSVVMLWRRRAEAILLWLPVLFYTVSIAYGSVPIFFPQWWPFSYYNTRYAVQALPAVAILAPMLLLMLPKWRQCAALALVLFVAAGWVLGVSRARTDAVIVLREARENSRDRRYAIEVLAKELPRGCQEIWMGSDWSQALAISGIPFRHVVQDGNRADWKRVQQHPERIVDCVIEQQGDGLHEAIAKLPQFERLFHTVLDVRMPGAAPVRLWRRNQ